MIRTRNGRTMLPIPNSGDKLTKELPMSEREGKNLLCYGDNLTFLSDNTFFPDDCIDLIYLDPPFNSQQSYNVLFREASGTPAAAQIKAFVDTWTWDMAANEALTQIHNDTAVPAPLVELMKTFMGFLGASPMMAYLVQMAIRLVHMHRILKPSGSLYLHCDPTASHYLKLVLDAIFGATNFRNEIIWKRSQPKSHTVVRLSRSHDVMLFYAKSQEARFNTPYLPHDPQYVQKFYKHVEPETGRRFMLDNLLNPNKNRPNLTYEFPPGSGTVRVWRWTTDRMLKAWKEGLVVVPKEGGVARYKRYLDEMPGTPATDLWTDIEHLHGSHAESLGYPTQKPVELLARVVRASSNPGDVVLDPFCGCGTTIDAVEMINRENEKQEARRWIGIDITHLSINLIKHRLTRFVPLPEYGVIGEPESVSGAEVLAQDDWSEFECWALGLIGARPIGGKKKKGADRGIDGVRYFVDEMKGKQQVTKTMLVQVKSGHVKAGDIRDFVGTITRDAAEMGVFITLKAPTRPMRTEAGAAGTYTSPWDKQNYPKVQILTIEELLADPQRPNPRCLQIPGGVTGPSHTLPVAPKHKQKRGRQLDFQSSEQD